MARGVRTTCQFNSKIFYPDGKTPNLWTSDPLHNFGFDDDKHSFFADNVSLDLAEDGSSYTIKSAVNEENMVNLKFTRAAPGFVVGKDGTSYFGTDPEHPWGSMRHAFWPRCTVEGKFITKTGEVDMKGKGLFVHALQGMKPHHAGNQRLICSLKLVRASVLTPCLQLHAGTLSTFSQQITRRF